MRTIDTYRQTDNFTGIRFEDGGFWGFRNDMLVIGPSATAEAVERELTDRYGFRVNGYPLETEPGKHTATAEEIAECVRDIKLEILDDIATQTVPASVATFAELHDHVDANCYGDFCEDGSPRENWDAESSNMVQTIADGWLRLGRPAD